MITHAPTNPVINHASIRKRLRWLLMVLWITPFVSTICSSLEIYDCGTKVFKRIITSHPAQDPIGHPKEKTLIVPRLPGRYDVQLEKTIYLPFRSGLWKQRVGRDHFFTMCRTLCFYEGWWRYHLCDHVLRTDHCPDHSADHLSDHFREIGLTIF